MNRHKNIETYAMQNIIKNIHSNSSSKAGQHEDSLINTGSAYIYLSTKFCTKWLDKKQFCKGEIYQAFLYLGVILESDS